jgi:hypothetical protein
MIRRMIQFPKDDSAKPADLQRRSRINGGEWMRALLTALVEEHELPGPVALRFAVVSRGTAEQVG